MTAAAGDPALRRPFVGLEPYEEGDASFFFGREREERRLIGNLRGFRFTVLYGASGVGKSSVLGAGVVHRLRTRRLDAAPEPVGGQRTLMAVTYFSDWRGERPLSALMDGIHASVVEATGLGGVPRWDGRCSVVATLSEWTQHVRELLIVLDQFEEYFLYQVDTDGGDEFARVFPEIVNDVSIRVHFLVSIREDAWAKLDRFKAALPNPFSNYIRLGYLERDAARRAIECAIEVYNAELAGGSRVTVEPALIEAVLDGVRRRRSEAPEHPAGRPELEPHIETAFLQVVMERVWDATLADGSHALRRATLDALGGPQQIVRNHLERSMGRLRQDEQAVAADALRFLVTSSRTKIAQQVSDLADWTGRPQPQLRAVLDRLCAGGVEGARILRSLPPDSGDSSPRYELFHDVLGEAILDWRKTFELERETETLAEQRIEEERERHAQQINRIFRVSAIALALLTAALAVAVVLAWRQQRIAESQGVAASAMAQLDTDPELSLLLAREAWKLHGTPAADEALRVALGASLVRVRIASGDRRAVASPRGDAIATWGDEEVRLWSPDDGHALDVTVRPGGEVNAVAFSPNGTLVAATGTAGAVVQPVSGGAPVRLRAGRSPAAVAVSGGDRFVAVASADGTTVLDASTGRRLAHASIKRAAAVAFDPAEARVVATARCDKRGIALWRWRSDALQRLPAPGGWGTSPELAGAGCALAFRPDGSELAAAPKGDRLRVWMTADGRLRETIPVDRAGVMAIDWRPDGRRLVAAASDYAVELDPRSGARGLELRGHGDTVAAVDYDAAGNAIATASIDGTARVWDASAGTVRAELRGHSNVLRDVAFIAGGDRVLTAADDGTERIWAIGAGRSFPSPDRVIDAQFSPDGRRVATAAVDGTARVWDAGGGRHVDIAAGDLAAATTTAFVGDRVLVGGVSTKGQGVIAAEDDRTGARPGLLDTGRGASSAVVDIDVSLSGRELLVTPYVGAPAVWDLARRTRIGALQWRTRDYTGRAEYSADGKLIATGGTQGAQIFDAHTLRRRAVLAGSTGTVAGASFSPAGDQLVTYGSDRTARLWSWPDRRLLANLRGHDKWVTSAMFSADGQRVVTASADRTVRVWGTDGRLLAIEPVHSSVVNSVAFSPDGRSILTSSDDRTARISACDTCGSTEEILRLAQRRVTRPLTAVERRAFLNH
jgi:WD40 repeat protein